MFAKSVVFLVLFVFAYGSEIDNNNKFGDLPKFKSRADFNYVEYFLCKIGVIQNGMENSCLETVAEFVCIGQNGQDSFPNLPKTAFKPNSDFATKEISLKTNSDEEKGDDYGEDDFDEDFDEDDFDEDDFDEDDFDEDDFDEDDFDEDDFDEDDFDEDFDENDFDDDDFDEEDFFHKFKNYFTYEEDLPHYFKGEDFDEDFHFKETGEDRARNIRKPTNKLGSLFDLHLRSISDEEKGDDYGEDDFDEDFDEDDFDEDDFDEDDFDEDDFDEDDFDEDDFDEDDFDEDFDENDFDDDDFDEEDFFHKFKNYFTYEEDLPHYFKGEDLDEDFHFRETGEDRARNIRKPTNKLGSLFDLHLRSIFSTKTKVEKAIPYSFPYQVAIMGEKISFLDNDDDDDDEGEDSNYKEDKEVDDDNNNFCGGSLISRKFVLTAAHCVYKKSLAIMFFGIHNIWNPESSTEYYFSLTFIIHEGWSPENLANDIALIELPSPIILNEYITTVGLPDFSDVDELFVGEAVTIPGWGKIVEDGALLYTESTIISNEICKTFLPILNPTHICTSLDSLFCKGDSGSPLVVKNKQIGIASFTSRTGCKVGWPAAFTRITRYLDWISKNSDVFLT